MSFGDRFKLLRKEKGLKQQELADEFNDIYGYTFAKSSISQYENNKRVPEVEALKDYAKYFNVSTDFLLFGNTEFTAKTSNDFIIYIERFFNSSDVNRKEKDEAFEKLATAYFNGVLASD